MRLLLVVVTLIQEWKKGGLEWKRTSSGVESRTSSRVRSTNRDRACPK